LGILTRKIHFFLEAQIGGRQEGQGEENDPITSEGKRKKTPEESCPKRTGHLS